MTKNGSGSSHPRWMRQRQENDKKMTNCLKKMQQNSNACDNKITKNNTAKHKKITN